MIDKGKDKLLTNGDDIALIELKGRYLLLALKNVRTAYIVYSCCGLLLSINLRSIDKYYIYYIDTISAHFKPA